MPVTPTYPGVYIEEVPSRVRTIVGVSTSIAAFIGYFARGPMDTAVQVFNMGDFEREFGGLDRRSEVTYAVQQFFANGGREAWIIRTASGAQKAAIDLLNAATGGSARLTVTASNEGVWGNDVRLDVDYATTNPGETFNLMVSELATADGETRVVRTEAFRNLSMDPDKPNCAVEVVNDGSTLVTLAPVGTHTATTPRPAETGTISDNIATLPAVGAADPLSASLNGGPALGPITLGAVPSTHEELRATLQAKIRGLAGLEKATVELLGSKSTPLSTVTPRLVLRIKAGAGTASDVLTFTGALATALGLDDAARSNVQQYELGGTAKAAQGLPSPGGVRQSGADGNPPTASELRGSRGAKTGLYALEDVDIFNILCSPRTAKLSDTEAAAVIAEAETYCQERRAFYIVDFPNADKTRDEPSEIKDWLDDNATLRHKNAALYYPRIKVADPLNDYRLRLIGAGGTVAGLYARIDGERGVWKAPAGIEGALRGVQELEYALTDQENGTLNPLGINCLRNFPVHGNVCWGARTLVGSDQQASEWKYIPVRRLALYIEESLYRGTQWVVFEPNDEPLWSQIRLNVGAFMHNLFRQGAFQGTTPREAYFVKCDSEMTTQNDIDLGIVNILVGFAPLKPAEFVIIKISQIAGQIET